jgi:hypothetical protein
MNAQEITIDHDKTLIDFIKKQKERIKRLKDRCKDRE